MNKRLKEAIRNAHVAGATAADTKFRTTHCGGIDFTDAYDAAFIASLAASGFAIVSAVELKAIRNDLTFAPTMQDRIDDLLAAAKD